MEGIPGMGLGLWSGVEMYLGETLCGIPMASHNVYYVKSSITLDRLSCHYHLNKSQTTLPLSTCERCELNGMASRLKKNVFDQSNIGSLPGFSRMGLSPMRKINGL
jgi:hypothetical protein